MDYYAPLKAFLLWFDEQVASEKLYPSDKEVAVAAWMAAFEFANKDEI